MAGITCITGIRFFFLFFALGSTAVPGFSGRAGTALAAALIYHPSGNLRGSTAVGRGRIAFTGVFRRVDGVITHICFFFLSLIIGSIRFYCLPVPATGDLAGIYI